jgi:hypothetical protein
MIKEFIATVAIGSSAYAGLPVAHEYNPEQHSGMYVATVTRGSKSAQVEIRNFGIEECLPARQFGAKLADMMVLTPDEAKNTTQRQAVERYPSSVFDQHCFIEQARLGFREETIHLRERAASEKMRQ